MRVIIFIMNLCICIRRFRGGRSGIHSGSVRIISIRVFLNFGSGSVQILAGSVWVWITHLNYLLNFKIHYILSTSQNL